MITGSVSVDLAPLQGLKRTLASKILRKAMTKASKVIKSAVKVNSQASKRFGLLNKSIGSKVKVYRNSGVVVGIVGPRSKMVWEGKVRTRGKHKGEPVRYRPSYYAHLVERGSKRSKAHPFLQPAITERQSQFLDLLSTAIRVGIQQQLAKGK